MNVILSRKGTDSGSGGIYSPLEPNTGEYAFLMRPESEKTSSEHYIGVPYETLPTNFLDFSNAAEILLSRNKTPSYGAHLDPDLTKVVPFENWKPIFGQRGAAQGYLRNRGVGIGSKGDLFLFFSRFKPWNKMKGPLTEGYYIYGWLEVGETYRPNELPKTSPYRYHPHFQENYIDTTNNIIYVASDTLVNTQLPGAGMFKRLSSGLQLSYHTDTDLLKFQLPSCAYQAFSRLKDYKEINSHSCTAKWPASYGQAAVCSTQIKYKPSKEQIQQVNSWAISKIINATNNGKYLKKNSL